MADVIQDKTTMIGRDGAMIRLALDDLVRTYRWMGGGGISEIRQLATFVFRVSLPQEERIDHVTYTFAVDEDGRLRIVRREESHEQP